MYNQLLVIKKFFPIISLTFVNVIGFSLLIPVFPHIVRLYVPEQYISIVYGLLLSSYSLFQFVGAPILGALSDKHGRKPLLILSQLGTTLSWVLFGFAYLTPNIPIFGLGLPIFVIILSRIVDGVTGGNVSVANAWVSDVTTPEERTKAFGLIGATFGIGFLIGPAIGGLSASAGAGYIGTVIVAFVISLLTLLQIGFMLPESLPIEKRVKSETISYWAEINILNKFKIFRNNLAVKKLLIVRLFIGIIFSAYTTIIILFIEKSFTLDALGIGLTLSFVGMFSIFNQAFLTPKFATKIGDKKTLYIGLAIISIGLSLIPLIPTTLYYGKIINIGFILFLFNAFFMNLGISLSLPTFKALLTKSVDETKQGIITGIDESLLALGNSFTPVIAGFLYSFAGVLTFLFFSTFLLIPFIFFKIRYKSAHL